VYLGGFFHGVVGRLAEWIINVVHLGFQPSEIARLSYFELKYYGGECHSIIQGTYKRQLEEIKKKAGV
jgi:23S rRNA maturation-related 3'-5' exoribonuclease YhaM